MASAAIRSMTNASRARLSSMSVMPTTNRMTASRLTSSASLSHSANARYSSSSSSSSDTLPRSRQVQLGAAIVLAVAGFTLFQLNSASNDATPAQPNKPGTPGLNPKDWTPLALKSVKRYNHNSSIYTFALPDSSAYLNLPVSSCVMLRYKGVDGKDVIRPYTPIDTQRKGEVVLLIKEYEKGNMSKYVTTLKKGDTLDFKGPMPKLKYEANMKKKIGMFAGGTGISPMMQVLEEIANNPKDKTEAHLVLANVSSKDILLKETIDSLVKQHKNIKVTYVIDTKDSEKDWAGEVGRIDKDFIKRVVPFSPADKDVLIYVCGPPGFMAAISGDKAKDYSQGEVSGALKELGFSKDQVYKF